MRNFSSKNTFKAVRLLLGSLIAILFFARLGGIKSEKHISPEEVSGKKDPSLTGDRSAVLAQNSENPHKFLFAGCSGFF